VETCAYDSRWLVAEAIMTMMNCTVIRSVLGQIDRPRRYF
jgi:hypothetical protein